MSNYCLECVYRSDHKQVVELKTTNKGTKCMLEYTQNPRTLKAMLYVYRNNGEVCFKNPFRQGEVIRSETNYT